jgi:hypothetical protein
LKKYVALELYLLKIPFYIFLAEKGALTGEISSKKGVPLNYSLSLLAKLI